MASQQLSWLDAIAGFADSRTDRREDGRANEIDPEIDPTFARATRIDVGAHAIGEEPSWIEIVPGWVPFPRETVFVTGIIELAGAIALLIPRTRWWAGVLLALYVLAVWPANFKHAFEHIEFTYIPDSWWYQATRLALQPVIAWWALFCAGVVNWPMGPPLPQILES